MVSLLSNFLDAISEKDDEDTDEQEDNNELLNEKCNTGVSSAWFISIYWSITLVLISDYLILGLTIKKSR